MNRKPWITTAFGVAIVSLALSAPAANAGQYAVGKSRASHAVYDYAKVLSVEPIVRYVTVEAPVRECWQEEREYRATHRARSPGGTLVGAIIGGVVGHQFGSGRGNDVATVAGTLIGAAVGNDVGNRRSGERDYDRRYSRPVERCATRYQSREEERIDGYDVVYRYKGQRYATRMPYDPGDRLRVRVDVRPSP